VTRVRIFIDFWNFQAGWNARLGRGSDGKVAEQCDWTALPRVLLRETQAVLNSVGIEATCSLEETLVYASVDPAKTGDEKLRGWLANFVDRLPSFKVTIHERRSRPFAAHCRQCGVETSNCPSCGAGFQRSVEKGVDTALVTDLLALGLEGGYDAGLLVSSDADFAPAVRFLQARGKKVINVAWPGEGHELKKACWADVDLDRCKSDLFRRQ